MGRSSLGDTGAFGSLLSVTRQIAVVKLRPNSDEVQLFNFGSLMGSFYAVSFTSDQSSLSH